MGSIFAPMTQDAMTVLGIEPADKPEVSVLPKGKEPVSKQDINYTTEIIGYKWRPEILWVLTHQECYFLELLHQLPGITRRALSLQLKELEKMDFLTRQEFKGIPVRVKYTITPKGLSLKPVLQAMEKWGRQRKLSLESGMTDIPKKKTAPKPPPPPSNILTLF